MSTNTSLFEKRKSQLSLILNWSKTSSLPSTLSSSSSSMLNISPIESSQCLSPSNSVNTNTPTTTDFFTNNMSTIVTPLEQEKADPKQQDSKGETGAKKIDEGINSSASSSSSSSTSSRNSLSPSSFDHNEMSTSIFDSLNETSLNTTGTNHITNLTNTNIKNSLSTKKTSHNEVNYG
jgi:hypothetical protein